MIFSVLEGVYDDFMRGSFDNYENRRTDIEQLMAYGEQFDDILEFLAQLSLMWSVDGDPTGNRAEPDDEKVTLVVGPPGQGAGVEGGVRGLADATGMFPNGRVLEAEDEDDARGGTAPVLRRDHPGQGRTLPGLPDDQSEELHWRRDPAAVALPRRLPGGVDRGMAGRQRERQRRGRAV